MSIVKKLAGETALYGLPSIVGRLLNYFLVPLYVTLFSPAAYGVSSLFYAYASFGAILFSHGMETAFFRFYQQESNKEKVFSTAFISLLFTCFIMAFALFIFAKSFATWTGNGQHTAILFSYLAIILAADALSSIVFALLRQLGKAKKFAALKMLNITTGIFLNLFFFLLCPYLIKNGFDSLSTIYNDEKGIEYIFIANVMSSLVVFPFLISEIKLIRFGFDKQLWKQMITYAFPLIFMGLAGMINETLDRVLLKALLPEAVAAKEIGIYAAVYKLAILITLFIQAFRFAAEPFFFSQMKDQNATETYAKVMNYFVMVCCVIFLVVLFYLDILKYFIPNKAYWEGLKVVPILLLANIFLGIYYNLSIWYKLINKTALGARVALVGAAITLLLNFLWIPSISYVGSAYATLICYFSMCVMSYFLGQKHYPVPYHLPFLCTIIASAVALYFVSDYFYQLAKISFWSKIILNTGLLSMYCGALFYWVKKRKI